MIIIDMGLFCPLIIHFSISSPIGHQSQEKLMKLFTTLFHRHNWNNCKCALTVSGAWADPRLHECWLFDLRVVEIQLVDVDQ